VKFLTLVVNRFDLDLMVNPPPSTLTNGRETASAIMPVKVMNIMKVAKVAPLSANRKGRRWTYSTCGLLAAAGDPNNCLEKPWRAPGLFDFNRTNLPGNETAVDQVRHDDGRLQYPLFDRHVVNLLQIFIRGREHRITDAIRRLG
jgi:hypothetical protein